MENFSKIKFSNNFSKANNNFSSSNRSVSTFQKSTNHTESSLNNNKNNFNNTLFPPNKFLSRESSPNLLQKSEDMNMYVF